LPIVAAKLEARFNVAVVACASQIGSGALPLETIPSAGLAIRPRTERGAGRALDRLAAAFRRLPVPVIGRLEDGALILDLRCLEDEAAFMVNFAALDFGDDHGMA
jgi:L-seryl-tRNA(Ser) seleniumtransferase